MDARGITQGELAEGSGPSTLEQLAKWAQWADKTLVF
jgi:sulfur relay (sulfurtransferase) complex TusBCD TusD component (DsrE family)